MDSYGFHYAGGAQDLALRVWWGAAKLLVQQPESSRGWSMHWHKIAWEGIVIGVQPRIRLTRSYDQRSHSYLGYILRLHGTIGEERREFTIAVGQGAQEKHRFRVGDAINGIAMFVEDPKLETAEFYKACKLRFLSRGSDAASSSPPWLGAPPPLSVYRERGHRRLHARTFERGCKTCMWGCRMAVEMIIDHWNPSRRRYRQETFCYGPLSCPEYKAGPTRKVPGRNGMSWEEEDWVDEQDISHRAPDE